MLTYDMRDAVGNELFPVYLYMLVSIYMYMYINICMHACMHACMYVCMYVCMYIYYIYIRLVQEDDTTDALMCVYYSIARALSLSLTHTTHTHTHTHTHTPVIAFRLVQAYDATDTLVFEHLHILLRRKSKDAYLAHMYIY